MTQRGHTQRYTYTHKDTYEAKILEGIDRHHIISCNNKNYLINIESMIMLFHVFLKSKQV